MSEALTAKRIDAETARRRQIIRATLAVIVHGMLGFAWFWLFTREIPAGNKEVIIALVGTMTGVVGTIDAFYFGDSEGKG